MDFFTSFDPARLLDSLTTKPEKVGRISLTYAKRSELYKFLERSDWVAAIKRAQTNPEEAQAWHETGEENKGGGSRHSLLALHAAILFDAPKEVVFALLSAYSDALQLKDSKGSLPIHLVMRKNEIDESVVEAFLLLYPDGCTTRDGDGVLSIAVYNKNTTQLFRFIEAKKWDNAIRYVKFHPNEATTWVYRREKTGKLRWRLSPLHAAIIYSAPAEMIEALLTADPKGGARKDDQNMLPLHLAFRNNAPTEIIQLLTDSFPEGIRAKDKYDKIPLEHSRSIVSDRKGIVEIYADAKVRLLKSRIEKEQDETIQMKISEVKSGLEQSRNGEKMAEEARLFKKNELIVRIKTESDAEIAKVKNTMKEKLAAKDRDYAKLIASKDEEYKKLKEDSQKEIAKLKEELATTTAELKKVEHVMFRRQNVVDEVMVSRVAERKAKPASAPEKKAEVSVLI